MTVVTVASIETRVGIGPFDGFFSVVMTLHARRIRRGPTTGNHQTRRPAYIDFHFSRCRERLDAAAAASDFFISVEKTKTKRKK